VIGVTLACEITSFLSSHRISRSSPHMCLALSLAIHGVSIEHGDLLGRTALRSHDELAVLLSLVSGLAENGRPTLLDAEHIRRRIHTTLVTLHRRRTCS
jgi:hypothetical protein